MVLEVKETATEEISLLWLSLRLQGRSTRLRQKINMEKEPELLQRGLRGQCSCQRRSGTDSVSTKTTGQGHKQTKKRNTNLHKLGQRGVGGQGSCQCRNVVDQVVVEATEK
jgi:hypothetical protein